MNDKNELDRFVSAQNAVYKKVLFEIANGKKESHWMWYIFPQLKGLGKSMMSEKYAIKSIEEARNFLKHPILGKRIIECAEILYKIDGKSANEIFGRIDSMKLKSSMTLFKYIAGDTSVFHKIIDKFYSGKECHKTLQLIDKSRQDKILENNDAKVYVIDELLMEINNLIFFGQINNIQELISIVPSFIYAKSSNNTICVRHIKVIDKYFFIIYSHNPNRNKNDVYKNMSIYVGNIDLDKLNLSWGSTDDLAASMPETDFLYSHSNNSDFLEFPDKIREVLSINGLKLVVSLQGNKIEYGTELEKLKHKGRIEISDYTVKEKSMVALEAMRNSGNINAKYALKRANKMLNETRRKMDLLEWFLTKYPT